MSTVQILLSRRRHPGSVLIRTTTWSAWSHVDLMDGESLIGAVAPHGVERERLDIRLSHASLAAVMTIPCDNADIVIAAAESQIGKPYDWFGALGIGLHRDWQDMDRWFCSEIVAWAFQEAGQPLFRAEVLHRITPQHLWMLPYKVRLIKAPAECSIREVLQ